jgi:late competence protein required for DNA uptake (superfamily II DNA/RNA helicase)
MIFSDVYYLIKHIFAKDKCICPKCGYNAFKHGFFPEEKYYCTNCNLWMKNA